MINNYMKNVKSIYPNISIENFYLNEMGQNNDVLIVNHL